MCIEAGNLKFLEIHYLNISAINFSETSHFDPTVVKQKTYFQNVQEYIKKTTKSRFR